MRLRGALRALTAVDNVDNYRRQVLGLAHLSNKLSRQNRRGEGDEEQPVWRSFKWVRGDAVIIINALSASLPPWDPSLIVINACCGT